MVNVEIFWNKDKFDKWCLLLDYLHTVLFIYLFIFRAVPAACGGSQARGWIRGLAASLHHSHSNARPQPHLRPTPHSGQHWILNTLSEARDWTCILMNTSQIHFCWATMGTPHFFFLLVNVILWCYRFDEKGTLRSRASSYHNGSGKAGIAFMAMRWKHAFCLPVALMDILVSLSGQSDWNFDHKYEGVF